ncbi:hypothetical protein EMN47_19570 [Prolixibacteraceae bacterium JC049]|nr:hypothetical protein [Prolixibacteraceae bacterium JC049]
MSDRIFKLMKKVLLSFALVVCCLVWSSASEKRDLLQKEGKSVDWQKIVNNKSWISFPAYQDRSEWEKIDAKIRKDYIKRGEKYLDYDWPTIPASTYLDFLRTGSRDAMQKPYGARTRAFESLIMAELMEGKGRFMDQIINGVWEVCEMTYWGLSAHLTLQKRGAGLPDVNDPTIDLGVGKLATNLAWTHHFFKTEFDKVNPLISERIVKEIRDKVLEPYYKRNDFWWQGFRTSFVNNWNPWCNYNVLNCIMLIEPDAAKREAGIKKALHSVDQFINYNHDDGGCEEGPSYWSHAGGKLFDVLNFLYVISDGSINIFDQPVVKNIGNYIAKAYISNPYFINFADASARIHTRPGTIYRYGKFTQQKELKEFGTFLAKKYHFNEKPLWGKVELSLANLFEAEEIMGGESHEPLYADFWLHETEIMGARDKAASTTGFYFAAKGGYNNESHNHNDAGSCVLYYNGEPFLADAGVGTYTRKTFSKDRYTIWTMQSQYHNLPRINGVDQKNGKNFKATQCQFKSTSRSVTFSAELAEAYPEKAKVKSWKRSYRLNRGKSFTITDAFELKEVKGENKLFFITPCKVNISGKSVVLEGKNDKLQLRFNASKLSAKVEEVNIEDNKIKRQWKEGLRRVVLTFKSKKKTDKNTISVIKMK